MIECSSCHTLNPEGEAKCLLCRAELALPQRAAAAVRCAAGHPIDPSWRSCPYCERQAGGQSQSSSPRTDLGGTVPPRPTLVEEQPTAQLRHQRASAAAAGAVRATRLESPANQLLPHPTVLSSAVPAPPGAGAAPAVPGTRVLDATAGAAAPALDTRPLVAVLAAPLLRAGGAVFAVRAGKNVLGASDASDICLAEDRRVSAEHAILLYRGGTFQLADRMSSNGTWLNGREVPANGAVEVRDRDRIRCGGVELVLLVIDGAAGSAAAASEPGRSISG